MSTMGKQTMVLFNSLGFRHFYLLVKYHLGFETMCGWWDTILPVR